MAHITEISIEGLLGRPDPIRVKLDRGVNIFFGENGCGKTTLLKVLDAALSSDGAAMERLPVTKATVDIFSINDDKVLRHTWERRAPEAVNHLTTRQMELLVAEREYFETADGRVVFRHARPEVEWKVSPARKGKTASARWAHTVLLQNPE